MDELDTVLSYGTTDNPGERAFTLARGLYGRLMLACRNKDEEEDGTYFTDICMGHTTMFVNVIAKCYQTMIDKGDVE